MSGISNREALKKAYPNQTWSKKVDEMTEGQVSAIFLRLRGQGKL